MRTVIFLCLSSALAVTEPFCLEVLDGNSVPSTHQYLGIDESSVIIDNTPKSFFMQDNHLCLSEQQCISVTSSGVLSVSSQVQDASTFFFDPETGDLEMLAFERNKNLQFYRCEKEYTETILALGDSDDIDPDCRQLRIAQSSHDNLVSGQLTKQPSGHLTRALHTIGSRLISQPSNLAERLFKEARSRESFQQRADTPNRLLIVDSTGKYSSKLCEESLARGYEVNLLLTSQRDIPKDFRSSVSIFQGQLDCIDILMVAMKDGDVVISTVIPSLSVGQADQSAAIFYQNLIGAMNNQGVKRLIAVGPANPDDQTQIPRRKIGSVVWKMTTRIFKTYYSQWSQVNDIISSSGLQYTFLKFFKSYGSCLKKPTPYQVGCNDVRSLDISRSNIVHSIFQALETNEWMYQMPVLRDS